MPSLTLEANSVIQEAPSRNSAPLYWSDSGRCLLGPALNVVWSRTKIMVLWTDVILQREKVGQREGEKPPRPWNCSPNSGCWLGPWRDISGGYIARCGPAPCKPSLPPQPTPTTKTTTDWPRALTVWVGKYGVPPLSCHHESSRVLLKSMGKAPSLFSFPM